MIDTDLKYLESELKEVINLFDDGENLNITHRFKQSDGKVVNTVTINGKVFAYGNLIGNVNDEIIEKRLIKRYAKLSMYKALSKLLNVNLPWGALTGIRPTKLAYSEIEENGDFKDFFTDVMKVSKEKTELTKSVIEKGYSLFEVHNITSASAYIKKNTPSVICINFLPALSKSQKLFAHPKTFYVENTQNIEEIEQFLH